MFQNGKGWQPQPLQIIIIIIIIIIIMVFYWVHGRKQESNRNFVYIIYCYRLRPKHFQ
jgi:hypothetical protein